MHIMTYIGRNQVTRRGFLGGSWRPAEATKRRKDYLQYPGKFDDNLRLRLLVKAMVVLGHILDTNRCADNETRINSAAGDQLD